MGSEGLERLLKDENRRYVFSLIHKFRKRVTEPWNKRDDVIVVSDEAHRTQYGRLALNMRMALQRDCRIRRLQARLRTCKQNQAKGGFQRCYVSPRSGLGDGKHACCPREGTFFHHRQEGSIPFPWNI